MIAATVLHPGAAAGPTMVLDEPLSLWGGFEPRTGVIIDIHHPQYGQCLTGRVVLMRESRGSGTASGAIAEAIRRGTGPAAIILVAPDVNLAIGAGVAETLYGRPCPVLAVTEADFESLRRASKLRISPHGAIAAETV